MKQTTESIRATVRSLLVIMLVSVVVTACGARREIEVDKGVMKKEMPLWQVLTVRKSTASLSMVLDRKAVGKKYAYEDRWYKYVVDFETFKPGQINRIIASCPIAQAHYTVTDKRSAVVVRNETIPQQSCTSCHPY